MARFLELPQASGRSTVFVNMDTVTKIYRLPASRETSMSNAMPERSGLEFIGDTEDALLLEVLPLPEAILASLREASRG